MRLKNPTETSKILQQNSDKEDPSTEALVEECIRSRARPRTVRLAAASSRTSESRTTMVFHHFTLTTPRPAPDRTAGPQSGARIFPSPLQWRREVTRR